MNETKTGAVSLTADQVDSLLTAERLIHDLLPQLDKLEKCGKQCQMLREQARQVAEQARLIRQYFDPNGVHTS